MSINTFTFYQNHTRLIRELSKHTLNWAAETAQKIKSSKINCDRINELRFHRKYHIACVIIKNAHERAKGQTQRVWPYH
jgi:hypothetical protein